MTKIILITGDLATGKSTFSQILASEFNLLVLNKDNIKEILADNIGFTDRMTNLKLSDASIAIMFYVLKQMLNINKSIILEANFHQKNIDILYDIIKDKASVLVLNLRAQDEIIYNRFVNRIKNEGRHKVHQSANLTDLNKFVMYVNEDRNNDFKDFAVINIDASDFTYQQDNSLKQKIRDFLNK